jgi:hypothetical protein
MNSNLAFSLWLPFVIVMIAWLFVTGLLAFIGGWRDLTTKYRADGTTIGQTFYFASAEIGQSWLPVRYQNCLTFVVGEKGFHVEPWLIFRFLSPRLFIPWTEVETIFGAKHWFYTKSYRIKISRSSVSISVFGRLGTEILESWTASRSRLEAQRGS